MSEIPLKWVLLADLLPSDASPILDCGCGDGGFLKYLQSRGWRAEGLELDSTKVQRGRASGLRIEQRDLMLPGTWKSLEPHYGSIVFSDVLEHVEDPAWILRQAEKLLRPGGGILVSIPSIAYWKVRLMHLRGIWKYEEAGHMDRTHRWFFTRSTMLELFSSCNLKLNQLLPLPPSSPGLSSTRQTIHRKLASWRPTMFALGFLAWVVPGDAEDPPDFTT